MLTSLAHHALKVWRIVIETLAPQLASQVNSEFPSAAMAGGSLATIASSVIIHRVRHAFDHTEEMRSCVAIDVPLTR